MTYLLENVEIDTENARSSMLNTHSTFLIAAKNIIMHFENPYDKQLCLEMLSLYYERNFILHSQQ